MIRICYDGLPDDTASGNVKVRPAQSHQVQKLHWATPPMTM